MMTNFKIVYVRIIMVLMVLVLMVLMVLMVLRVDVWITFFTKPFAKPFRP